jgi:Peptidase family S41/N-terminal domain of Peptidase_S41 in eukaryotic IRBP
MDDTTRAEVVTRLTDKLRNGYVFSDVGERMADYIEGRLAAGVYDELADGDAFAAQLTEDMREISHDLHLRVTFSAEPRPRYAADVLHHNPEWVAEYALGAELRNFGVLKVERLPGNVGYFETESLQLATLAAETILGAFALLANTSALIIDLRRNGGGDPRTVALICSFLLEPEPVHLNSFYHREDNRYEQFWTWPWLPTRRYLDKPVWVLTSSRTFSGAEELSYNLKTLDRATLVGETTGGAAHPVDFQQLTPHFEAAIVFGRAVNPITGTNWEGAGVAPHIPTAAGDALRVAHSAALRHILSTIPDAPTRPWRLLRDEATAALAELEGSDAGPTATQPE